MKIHLLPFGTLSIPQSILYGDDFPSDKNGVSPMYGVLIDHPEGKILYDTGLWLDRDALAYTNTQHLSFTEEDLLENRLSSIGLTPDDIDYVVISHLHCDHCGNIHKFKNAEILVNREDFTNTLINYGLCTPKLMPPQYVQAWVAAKPKWRLIDAWETGLLPGVTVYAFGQGHTFGMLMLKVDTGKNGAVYMVQDLIYSKELMNKHKLPGIIHNEAGYYEAVAKIKDMAAKDSAAIWFGHDIEQFSAMKHVPDGYYE
jgi:glyoxylase-like metal-dependent hydrolase (beta-lactamase superfamily II)